MKKHEIVFICIVAAGLSCVVYGVSLLSHPAAWMAAGLSILALAALAFLDVK